MAEKTDELLAELDAHLDVLAAQLAAAKRLIRQARQQQEKTCGPDR